MPPEESTGKTPHEDPEENFESSQLAEPPPAPVIEETLTLPVGIEDGGKRYRKVTVDELSGIDDHLVSDKKVGRNGSKAMSVVLCRCIQEVEGLHPRKRDEEKMFDRHLARVLTQPDRDFLITRIHMLSGNDETQMAGECPRCGRIWEDTVLMSELPVIEWPEDKPLEIEFELIRGIRSKDGKIHKKGTLRFPTGKEQELIGDMDNLAVITDTMFSACITNLGDLKYVDQEMSKRLKKTDRDYLWNVIKKELPGIKQWKNVKCQCGREFDIVLDLAAFFEGRRRMTKR